MSDINQAHPVPRVQALAAGGHLEPRPVTRHSSIEKPAGMSQAQFDAMRQTAQDFEAMMLGEMLAPMFEGLEAGGPFGGGQAEETWRGFMVQEYGAEIARSGGIGIADDLVRQMLQLQER